MSPHPIAVALVLGTLVVLLLGSVLLEGRTVLRSLSGLRGSPAPLRRLGWTFLLSEVWLLATVGLAHAALPFLTHAALAMAWLPATLFVLGWMLRDWGLWQVVLRERAAPWPLVAGVGALVQVLTVLWGLALSVPQVLPEVRAGEVDLVPAAAGTSYGVLAVVAPASVLVVLALLLTVGRRLRGFHRPRMILRSSRHRGPSRSSQPRLVGR